MSSRQEHNIDSELLVLARRLLLTRSQIQVSHLKLREIAYTLADKVIATEKQR